MEIIVDAVGSAGYLVSIEGKAVYGVSGTESDALPFTEEVLNLTGNIGLRLYVSAK